MRSESLRRLHVEHPQPTKTDARRLEIASQVDAFLAAGGQIQQVGSEMNARPVFSPWEVTRENPQGLVHDR